MEHHFEYIYLYSKKYVEQHKSFQIIIHFLFFLTKKLV